jgi:putative thioredoxin
MDCYANWCGPCKKLTPMLEGAVTQAGGKIALAKVNADKCPNLMKQLGVNSLPTVFAVSDGQLVDSFSGVPTPDGLNKWISRILEEGGKVTATEDMAEVLEIAEQELSSGNIAAATSSFNEILQSPAKDLHHLAIAGLARCALEENNLEVARSLVKTLKENYKDKLSQPAVGKAISSVELRSEFEAKSGGASVKNKLKEYKDKVAQNPNDQEAMYNFAFTLFAAGKTEEAIEQLLDMIKKDRTWNDGAARKLLLRMFEALGQNNELTVNARKKFANIWFCG